MSPSHPFTFKFAPQVQTHLEWIDRKYYGLIRRTIRSQLSYSPEVQTRNRKLLEQPAHLGATWELRIGPNNRFRVFYEVEVAQHIVLVLAIGIKEGNRLIIGGKEFVE